MRGKRLRQTIRLFLTLSVGKRADYIRKEKIFASFGEKSSIMDRVIPLYANLIKIGNNVHIASNVHFITHDITHVMLNLREKEKCAWGGYTETVGCIQIEDNVFIGSGTQILSNVRIGKNVIVGAGALVNNDIPDNSVAAGVPARVICTLDEYLEKRRGKQYPQEYKPFNQEVSQEAAEFFWNEFYSSRDCLVE